MLESRNMQVPNPNTKSNRRTAWKLHDPVLLHLPEPYSSVQCPPPPGGSKCGLPIQHDSLNSDGFLGHSLGRPCWSSATTEVPLRPKRLEPEALVVHQYYRLCVLQGVPGNSQVFPAGVVY